MKNEADRTELIEILHDKSFKTDPRNIFLDHKSLIKTFNLLPEAIGEWLKNSEPMPDGSYRGEIHHGLVIRAKLKPGKKGEAFGLSYETLKHYEISIKFTNKALEKIGNALGEKSVNS